MEGRGLDLPVSGQGQVAGRCVQRRELCQDRAKWRVVVFRAVSCGSLIRGMMWRHGGSPIPTFRRNLLHSSLTF